MDLGACNGLYAESDHDSVSTLAPDLTAEQVTRDAGGVERRGCGSAKAENRQRVSERWYVRHIRSVYTKRKG
jgi:hypothetical protein